MSPHLVTAIIGLMLAVLSLGQAVPSITAVIASKNVENGIGREEALAQQIVAYRNAEGSYPTSVLDLVTKGYWRSVDNSNGFGGTYAFTVDSAKGLIVIETTIADADNRSRYLNNLRHTFKPVDAGSGVVRTSFVAPSLGLNALPVPTGQAAAVSSSAPAATSGGFWYDTSSGSPVLKVSDGTNWRATTTPGNLDSSIIVSSASALPTTASLGDIRYVRNIATQTIDTMIYNGSGWVLSTPASGDVGGISASVIGLQALSMDVAYVGDPYYFDFKQYYTEYDRLSLTPLPTQHNVNQDWMATGLPTGLTLSSTPGNQSNGVVSGIVSTTGSNNVNIYVAYIRTSVMATYSLTRAINNFTVTSIATSGSTNNTVCVINTALQLKCWGRNNFGQFGNGQTTDSADPVNAGGATFTSATGEAAQVSIGGGHVCGRGKLGKIQCWGQNTFGQLGGNGTTNSTTPIEALANAGLAIDVAAGESHTCAIAGAAKSVLCWGNQSGGRLGNNSLVAGNISWPVAASVLTSGVAQISTNHAHTCAVKTDGSLYCWGLNAVGQLGINNTTSQGVPTLVSTLGSVRKVSAGYDHTCAVKTTGEVYCWGGNGKGQVGVGDASLTQRNVPALVTLGQAATDIAAGNQHTCALLADRTVKCWGLNDNAQLGNSSAYYNIAIAPINVPGISTAVSVMAGNKMSCVKLATTNFMKCWGANTSNQISRNTFANRVFPMMVTY